MRHLSQRKLLRLYGRTATKPSFLRHFSSNPSIIDPPLPPETPEVEPKAKNPTWAIANEKLLELLQANDEDWNQEQIQDLVSSISSPSRLLQLIRRLPTSAKALKFFELIQNSNSSFTNALSSYAYNAIFELASREPDSHLKLSELLGKSKAQGIPLSVDSATILIRRFQRSGKVDDSFRAFNEVEVSNRSTHLCNTLLDVLFKWGRVENARELLDEMLQQNSSCPPNELTGSIVFSALLKRNQPGRSIDSREVIEFMTKLGDHEVFPDAMLLTKLVTRLCRSGSTNQAWELVHALMKMKSPLEAASCNALLAGLGRDWDFKRMNLLLAEMKEMGIKPNSITFGVLIHHLCKLRRVDEALEVLDKMTSEGEKEGFSAAPDLITYNTLVFGLCKVGRQEEGLTLVERMRSEPGCAPNTVTYNSLMDGFSKAGEIDKSLELFHKMEGEGVSPDDITLNILVDGMCKHGRISSALDFFNEMKKKGLKGNAITYTAFISAFCNVNNIGKAKELFDDMISSGCAPDAKVYYSLITGLSRAGRMDDACSVASKMQDAGFHLDATGYNVLINGFCKKRRLDKVSEILKEMDTAGVQPDEFTYNTLIATLSKSGDLSTARQLMNGMTGKGIVPTVVTYGALIHGYCLAGNLDEATKIFRYMGSTSKVPPNTVIYNILIQSHCKNDNIEEAIFLMDEMRDKGVFPNVITYNTMFKGLRERNWLDKAVQLMDDMIKQACNPDYITMEILTEWFSAAGKTESLRSFVQGEEISIAST